MAKLLHTSKVKIQKEPGNSKIKRAQVEGFPDVLRMGIHGGIAQYFKLSPDEPMPATLDYIVAAVGGHDPAAARMSGPIWTVIDQATPSRVSVSISA